MINSYFEQYIRIHPEMDFAGALVGDHGVESGYLMMQQWLSEDRIMPDAFFVSNDPIAIGAIKAFNEAHIAVPDKVSLIAINGDSSGMFSFPALTSVDVHTYEMGKEAVEVLAERLEKKRKIPKKIEFYPELVERGSVGFSQVSSSHSKRV